MTCDVSIPGLKKASYGEPIFDNIEQLYTPGNETKAHCDTFWQTVVAKPIDVQELLVNEQLNGNFGPDDLLLKRPKFSVLQPEPFHGNVAVNQYGLDHSWVMQVDNDHLLYSPKITSFAQNEVAPQLNKTPNITNDITNLLKTPMKLNVQGKIIGTEKTVTVPMFKSNFRSKLKFTMDATPLNPDNVIAAKPVPSMVLTEKRTRNVNVVDVSLLKKAAKKNVSTRAFQDRVARVIEALAVKSKDPAMSKDVEKILRDNLDIINQVVAFGVKDPKYQLVIERLTRDHMPLMQLGMEATNFKLGKSFGQSLTNLLKTKNDITFSPPINVPSKGDFVKGVTPTCFLDDRFVSRDQLDLGGTYARPPSPSIITMPVGSRCNKFEM